MCPLKCAWLIKCYSATEQHPPPIIIIRELFRLMGSEWQKCLNRVNPYCKHTFFLDSNVRMYFVKSSEERINKGVDCNMHCWEGTKLYFGFSCAKIRTNYFQTPFLLIGHNHCQKSIIYLCQPCSPRNWHKKQGGVPTFLYRKSEVLGSQAKGPKVGN